MNSRLTSFLALGFFLIVLGLVLWFGLPTAEESTQDERTQVVTSIYPLADFAENVGVNFVYVNNIVPAGAEPHDFEPTPRDLIQISSVDVILAVGDGFDAWIMQGESVLSVNDVVDMEPNDPHAWLDPVLAQEIVLGIRDALITADPVHIEQYRANAADYTTRLEELHQDYVAALADCELNDIIVSHDAFGYLARRYDFTIHPIAGLSPEAEPSVRDLSELASKAKKLGITTIFFETLVSPKLSETLAEEVGAETAVLNPLEGLSDDELQAGDDYLSVMRQNLEALSSAMLCQ